MKSGKIGSTPSFSELDSLPQTFKLNTTLSSMSDLITEDGYTGYTLVFDIDEEALGTTLDKLYLYDPINTDGYTFKTTPYLTLQEKGISSVIELDLESAQKTIDEE